MSLKQELESRWLVYQTSDDKLFDIYEKWNQSLYCGFDPTADSLHLGNFIGFMTAVHFMRRWNKYFAIVGWATWMIGDPGGKDSERSFLSEETLRKNEEAIRQQIGWLLRNIEEVTWEKLEYEVINNYDFFKNMSVLEFLREVWKYVTVNNMIKKDTVRKRIEDPDKSISYTEFSYMLLQWYDFYKLFKDYWVKLQIWGQDQWGNLVTGLELIRKKLDKEAYAMTFPLITDSNGKKFGKSEWNAIRLDPNKTSPFKLYQFLINTTDEDVERYLKILTLMSFEEIEKVAREHKKEPEKRYGQKVLAEKVVEIIHGKKQAQLAKKLSEFLFGTENKLDILSKLDKSELDEFVKEVGGKKYEGEDLLDLLVNTGLSASRWQAKKDIKAGSIYLNEKRVNDFSKQIEFNNNIALLRKWKKKYSIILN
jgi:tyrosyl-tRNA synthetase